MIGAHFAYKNTPLDFWAKNLFGMKRGIYDWFVHFSFGLLIVYPVREFIAALMRLRHKWLYTFTFSIILLELDSNEIASSYVPHLVMGGLY